MQKLIYTLVILFICLVGCKKNIDSVSPSITIIKPTQGKVFYVGDTLFIKAEVSDDKMLEWIKFDVIKANNAIAITGPEKQLNGVTSATVLEQIVLDDIHMESGSYHLRARAFDGENEKFVFKEITIYEAPRERLRLLCVSTPGPSTLKLDSIAPDGQVFPVATVLSDFSGASVNPWFGEITLFGRANGSINTFESVDLIAGGSVNINSGLDPLYHEVEFSADRLRHVATRSDGKVELFGAHVSLSFSFQTQSGFRPYHAVGGSDYVFVEERSLSGDNVIISAYHNNSGSLNSSYAIDDDVVSLFAHDDGVLLFTSGSEGNLMLYFDVAQGGVTDLLSLREDLGALIDVARYPANGSDDFFVLLYENGTDAVNVANLAQLFPAYQWSIQGDEVDVDEVGGQVLIRENEQLHIYLPGNATPSVSYDLPLGAVEIHLFYNK